jgi:V-type H+-transporting ATPase subunit d
LRLHLQSTDYGNFLANEASPLTVNVIDDRLREKLVQEFQHLRNVSYEPLSTFLDYITYVQMQYDARLSPSESISYVLL